MQGKDGKVQRDKRGRWKCDQGPGHGGSGKPWWGAQIVLCIQWRPRARKELQRNMWPDITKKLYQWQINASARGSCWWAESRMGHLSALPSNKNMSTDWGIHALTKNVEIQVSRKIDRYIHTYTHTTKWITCWPKKPPNGSYLDHL